MLNQILESHVLWYSKAIEKIIEMWNVSKILKGESWIWIVNHLGRQRMCQTQEKVSQLNVMIW